MHSANPRLCSLIQFLTYLAESIFMQITQVYLHSNQNAEIWSKGRSRIKQVLNSKMQQKWPGQNADFEEQDFLQFSHATENWSCGTLGMKLMDLSIKPSQCHDLLFILLTSNTNIYTPENLLKTIEHKMQQPQGNISQLRPFGSSHSSEKFEVEL